MTIKVKVILQSKHPITGKILTTFEHYVPRAMIHEEFLTHRMLSRNSSSSRAVSEANLIRQVRMDPALPVYWGLHKKGMADAGVMSEEGSKMAEDIWLKARDKAIASLGELTNLEEKPHKQISNILLRPWEHITVVSSGTEWANFMVLRRHEGAKPEFRELANQMYDAMKSAPVQKLKIGEWHLPFVEEHEMDAYRDTKDEEILKQLIKVSASRCARTSFKNGITRPISFEDDIELYDRLINMSPLHASPFEHIATPDYCRVFQNEKGKLEKEWENPHQHGNFVGFIQYRKTLPFENITEMPKE